MASLHFNINTICKHVYDWTVVPGKVTIDFDAIEVGKLTRQLSAGFPNMFAKVSAAWNFASIKYAAKFGFDIMGRQR